ncbi:MAG TPA: type II toxin-antitoxin system Phd/YefM family antitoxin [Propylenella sp.]
MSAMRATSFSELRRNLAKELDRVAEDHEPVIVTRGKGKPPAVILSLEDFGLRRDGLPSAQPEEC